MAIFKSSLKEELENNNEDVAKKAALAIKEFLDGFNLEIENLRIEFVAQEAKVIVYGEALNQEVIEKSSEILEDIQGISLVENLIKIKEKKSEETTYHNVQAGETLEAISKIYFGDESKADEIYQANLNILDESKKLYSGLKLLIPVKNEGES